MKILVLGVGNVLYRDEAVGVKTVLKMQEEYSFPEMYVFLTAERSVWDLWTV